VRHVTRWWRTPSPTIAALASAAVSLILACGEDKTWHLTPAQEATLASYRHVETISLPDGPALSLDVFEMTYGADYAFDAYMAEGGGTTLALYDFINDHLLHQADAAAAGAAASYGCASFTARDAQGHVLFGRNWDQGYAMTAQALVMRTAPPGGYAAIAVTYVPYVQQYGSLLAAPYVIMDGMNEAGVAVSILNTDDATLRVDPQKPTLWYVAVLRLLLDHAGNVDEALALLARFNVSWDWWGYHSYNHLMIADRSGDSVVVEYHAGEMRVLRSGKPWQVVTNYDLDGKDPADLSHCWRYARAWSTLEAAGGVLPGDEAMSLLLDIAQATFWSAVYDLEAGTVRIAFMKNPARSRTYALREAGNP
jgi:hypothetical protein